MSKVCQICGKGIQSGRTIKRRGMAKAKGGAGQKITGHVHRRFLPNLQRVRVRIAGVVKTMRVCTRCIKAGKIQKA
ncbi:MAG: 50S ribosomal protein L28 [Candidatus Omnitrophota bacterium]|nr:50S ribosomal protein L28 [Candidatus Omnitrophota bacterium]